jgi:hypothetical protein
VKEVLLVAIPDMIFAHEKEPASVILEEHHKQVKYYLDLEDQPQEQRRRPRETEHNDYSDEDRERSPELKWEDHEGRIERLLKDYQDADIDDWESEHGLPEVRLVEIKRVPNIPVFVPKSRNPYVSSVHFGDSTISLTSNNYCCSEILKFIPIIFSMLWIP